jgi:hypothetical protein
MATFSQKKVWHSHLKQKSPIVIRWRGTPRQSDFGDYLQAYFDVRNDSEEGYYYVCEDEGITQQIEEAEKDVWLVVTAAGGKDGQVMDIRPDDGTTAVQNEGAEAPRQARGTYTSGSIIGDYGACFNVAQQFVDARLPVFVDTLDRFGLAKEMATTFYIQWSKSGFAVPLVPESQVEVTPVPDPTGEPAPESITSAKNKLKMLPKKSGFSHDSKQLKRVTDAMAEQLDGDPTKEQVAKMNQWLDKELTAQSVFAATDEEFVPEDELPF